MKKSKFKFYFILFVLPSALLRKAAAQDSLSFKKIAISTSLLEYFPNPKLYTINCNIGAEVYIKNGYSIFLGGGVLLPAGSPVSYIGIPSEQSKGYKFRLEGRRYLKRKKEVEPAMLIFWPHVFQYHNVPYQNSGLYTGLSSSFQFTETERKESVQTEVSPAGNPVYKDNVYFVNRNQLAMNLMLGFQCIKKSGFFVDYAVGLGIQLVSSSSSNRIGGDQNYPNSSLDWPMDKYFDYGTGIGPNLLYQVRLGYAF
jgi:hypothetical protein